MAFVAQPASDRGAVQVVEGAMAGRGLQAPAVRTRLSLGPRVGCLVLASARTEPGVRWAPAHRPMAVISPSSVP